MNKQMDSDFLTIFIFPFKYEKKGGEQLNPDQVAEALHKGNTKPEQGWAKKHFSPSTEDNYNEFYYFHPFVHNTIFNKKGRKRSNDGMEYLIRKDYNKLEVKYCVSTRKERIIDRIKGRVREELIDSLEDEEEWKKLWRELFDRDRPDDLIKRIEEKFGCSDRIKEAIESSWGKKITTDAITTSVNSIDMHLFDNQIGLLTITTQKEKETSFETFLRYNDIARRVYPLYLGKDGSENNTYAPKYVGKVLPAK